MDIDNVTTVILAGGQGSRLFPLTTHHCKPAVSYGGRYRLIDIPISNSIHSNFREIFVIAQYLSGELQHHINQTYHFGVFQTGNIYFLTPEEDAKGQKIWFSGTADAVRKTLPTLLKTSADYFLILSGDQLYNIDFNEMFFQAKKMNADLTIASLPVTARGAQNLGILRINYEGYVVDFYEKPTKEEHISSYMIGNEFYQKWQHPIPADTHYLASMGIYIFKREYLIAILQNDSREDFGKHIIPTAIKQGKTAAYIYHGYWEDIGTIASYYEANLLLTLKNRGLNTYDESKPIYTRSTFLPGPRISDAKIMQSIICEGSIIEACEITRSVIGLLSYIKRGTVIRDTLMLGNLFYMTSGQNNKSTQINFWVGENCIIEKTIIDEHVRIGNNVRLTNQENQLNFDGPGVYIRDGIIIVTSGTILPDNYVL